MSTDTKKTQNGGKLTRSEITTVRLDPKLRYLAELAARKQRRTLSSYIEWAVEMSLHAVDLVPPDRNSDSTTIDDEKNRLWDVDESERFIKLAKAYPELLTHEEQEYWKMLNDSGLLSPAKSRDRLGKIQWNDEVLEELIYPTIRFCWAKLKESHAAGSKEKNMWVKDMKDSIKQGFIYSFDDLEKWAPKKKSTGFPDMDDDIPF